MIERTETEQIFIDNLLEDMKFLCGTIYSYYKNKNKKDNKSVIIAKIKKDLGLAFMGDKVLNVLTVSPDTDNLNAIRKVFNNKTIDGIVHLRNVLKRTSQKLLFPVIETTLTEESLMLAFGTIQMLKKEFKMVHPDMKISEMKSEMISLLYDNRERFNVYTNPYRLDWFSKKLFSKRLFENNDPYELISNELCGEFVKLINEYKIK